MKFSTYSLSLILVASLLGACASQKKSQPAINNSQPKNTTAASNIPVNGASYAKVLEASSQRVLPGRKEGDIITNYELTVNWASDTPPVSFFWKDGERWMNCKVYSKPRVAGSAAKQGPVEIGPEQVKKGTTVQLIPTSGGKYPIPANMPPDLKKALFFKTASSGWMYLEVTSMTVKPDVKMP